MVVFSTHLSLLEIYLRVKEAHPLRVLIVS